MRHNRAHFAVFSLVWLALAFAGCTSQYAARQWLTREAASVTKETADLLATVKDRASAQAAAPRLQRLTDRMVRITDQFEALDTENEIYVGEDEERVLEEHGQWLAQQMRLMQEELRVGQIPEAREALGESWLRLTGGAFDPGGILASEISPGQLAPSQPPRLPSATSNQEASP